MPKSEKYSAPAIVGKAKEEPKPYLFRNRKAPGQSVKCWTGDAPNKNKNEWFRDTINQHDLVDGQVVYLKEAEYNHLNNLGVEKPITQENAQGFREPTGQTYIDRRFELDRMNNG